jgi:hypothetical protein
MERCNSGVLEGWIPTFQFPIFFFDYSNLPLFQSSTLSLRAGLFSGNLLPHDPVDELFAV